MTNEAKTRVKGDEIAKGPLPPCRPCAGVESKFDNVEVSDLVPRAQTVYAPLFNLSDGSKQIQGELGNIIEEVMGIKVDFVSTSSATEISHLMRSCTALVDHECAGESESIRQRRIYARPNDTRN